MNEADVQSWLASYIRRAYPNVLFHSDFGSGIKLTMGQAKKQKIQNGGRRAWPDMFIAQPSWRCRSYGNRHYCGLFLELKKDGTHLKKKNGEWASDHVAEQAEVLKQLRDKGYRAEFAIGIDEGIRIIDDYLCRGIIKTISDFKEKYGNLSVEEARELNEAARWYCEHDVISRSHE